jgi:hypothetical protein
LIRAAASTQPFGRYCELMRIQLELDIPHLFRGLCELADAPVDPNEFAGTADRLGWPVRENEYAPYGVVVQEVMTPFAPHRLIAVFSERSMAGIPLYILIDDERADSPYYLKTRSDFDSAFGQTQAAIEQASTAASASGVYESAFASGRFHYAVWARQAWFVALVQHDEGDGNYGHGPTLDLRLLPRVCDASQLKFPLDTNLIF